MTPETGRGEEECTSRPARRDRAPRHLDAKFRMSTFRYNSAVRRTAQPMRSERLRARALELVAKSTVLFTRSTAIKQRHQAAVDSIGEFRARLCELVTDHSATARGMDISPEGTLLLVKEAVADCIRALPVNTQPEIQADVVWWTIESYFTA